MNLKKNNFWICWKEKYIFAESTLLSNQTNPLPKSSFGVSFRFWLMGYVDNNWFPVPSKYSSENVYKNTILMRIFYKFYHNIQAKIKVMSKVIIIPPVCEVYRGYRGYIVLAFSVCVLTCFVKYLLGTSVPRILKFGTNIGYDKLYCVLKNQPHMAYQSLYLFFPIIVSIISARIYEC